MEHSNEIEVRIPVKDTNQRDQGLRSMVLEHDADGSVVAVRYEGQRYAYSRSGTTVSTGKAAREYATPEDARLWIAVDLSIAHED